MDSDGRQPDGAGRLRLLDVRLRDDGPTIRFEARLAAVLAEPGARSEAAHLIAFAVAGPRPTDVDGSVETDGEIVSVRTLASTLLEPDAPVLVDRAVVASEWSGWCAHRRDELAVEHASARLERHRIDAALERAGQEPETTADDGPEAIEVDEFEPVRVRLRALLDPPGRDAPPLPEGQLLADAWDAHTGLLQARRATDVGAAAALEPFERRVDDARRVVAEMPPAVPAEVQARIEEAHDDVLEAEAALLAAKRRKRAKSVERYEQAVAVELVALADAGIESYAAFLVAVAEGQAAEAGLRGEAEAELAAARAELDQARLVRDVPTGRELQDREELMVTRATELLGRPPGVDTAAELRALRVEPERTDDEVAEIAEALRAADVGETLNVVATARVFLAVPRFPRPAGAGHASTSALGPEEIAELAEQRREHEQVLAELEGELARLDHLGTVPVEHLPPGDLVAALDLVFDRYRSGALLDGRLPMVIDGVIDEIAPESRDAAVRHLAAADDIQIIVVSDDPELLQSLAYAGASLVRWPERH